MEEMEKRGRKKKRQKHIALLPHAVPHQLLVDLIRSLVRTH